MNLPASGSRILLLAAGLVLGSPLARAQPAAAPLGNDSFRSGTCSGMPCVELSWPVVERAEGPRLNSLFRNWFALAPLHGGQRLESPQALAQDFMARHPGWAVKRSWSQEFQSANVLCLKRTEEVHDFGRPPFLDVDYFVLQTSHAEQLGITDLFAPSSMPELTARAQRVFEEQYGSAANWNFQGGRFAVSEDFGIDATHLIFDWDRYEIGPGAGGAPTVRLAWTEVSDLFRQDAAIPDLLRTLGGERGPTPVVDGSQDARHHCDERDARIVRLRDGEVATFRDPLSAVAALEDGDSLWFCQGRHVVEERILVKGLRKLTLAGEDASIVSMVDAPVLSLEACHELRVEGLHVVHEIGSWCAENTMEIRASQDVIVTGCDLDGSGYFGLGLSGCDRARVENNVIRNSAYGLATWGGSDLTVRANTFRDNGRNFNSEPRQEWLSSNTIGPEGRRGSADAASYASPSFDCAAAGNPTEQAICEHPSLRAADSRMARLYSHLRGVLPGRARAELRDDQRAWVKARAGCESDALCLARVYETRINVLLDRMP